MSDATLESLLREVVQRKIEQWAEFFHMEMEKAKSIAANDDIRIGLTHGQIVFGKVFLREQGKEQS